MVVQKVMHNTCQDKFELKDVHASKVIFNVSDDF